MTQAPTDGPQLAAIILAAGRASRMGQPKQLLHFRGKTLIAYALGEALQVVPQVAVVVGAYAAEVRGAITATGEGARVKVIENLRWETGMASSIRVGVQHVADEANANAVLILTADQPFVEARHLQAMCTAFAHTTSSPQIVAAQYGGTLGIPAIFTLELFPRLLELTGDKGARWLLQDPGLRITPFPLPEAARDIDTPEDAAALG